LVIGRPVVSTTLTNQHQSRPHCVHGVANEREPPPRKRPVERQSAGQPLRGSTLPLSQAHNVCAMPTGWRFSTHLQLEASARSLSPEAVPRVVRRSRSTRSVYDHQGTAVRSRSPHAARFRSARQLPARPNKVTSVAARIAFQIILVLRLGLPKGAGRGHFRHHLARPKP
jgi:hypothetical protein